MNVATWHTQALWSTWTLSPMAALRLVHLMHTHTPTPPRPTLVVLSSGCTLGPSGKLSKVQIPGPQPTGEGGASQAYGFLKSSLA